MANSTKSHGPMTAASENEMNGSRRFAKALTMATGRNRLQGRKSAQIINRCIPGGPP